MKKYQITILAVSILFTSLGVGWGVKTNAKNKALELENNRLKNQLNQVAQKIPKKKTEKIAKKKEAPADLLVASTTPKKAKSDKPKKRNDSFMSYLKRMKKEDPKQYEKRMKRRKDFQERVKYTVADRTAAFMDLDTSKMTPEELAVHNQLIDRMGTTMEMIQQMDDPEKFDRKVMGKMFREVRAIRPLMKKERTTMLKIMSDDMGLEGESAKQFVEQVNGIISTTSTQMPFHDNKPKKK